MKKYYIRKGSLAYYVQKTYKPIAVLATVTILTGCMAAAAEQQETLEPVEPIEVMVSELPEPETWDIPLEKDLQLYVAAICEEKGIEPELVFAIIEQESQWNPEALGDNGKSKGLMQVQERWHSVRMEKLGCTNLLEPYDNVTVGIDILAEKLNKYATVGEALTAYNAGDSGAYKFYFSKGIYASDYALDVMAAAEDKKHMK